MIAYSLLVGSSTVIAAHCGWYVVCAREKGGRKLRDPDVSGDACVSAAEPVTRHKGVLASFCGAVYLA